MWDGGELSPWTPFRKFYNKKIIEDHTSLSYGIFRNKVTVNWNYKYNS